MIHCITSALSVHSVSKHFVIFLVTGLNLIHYVLIGLSYHEQCRPSFSFSTKGEHFEVKLFNPASFNYFLHLVVTKYHCFYKLSERQ